MFNFCNVIAGTKRSFGDLDDEEDDIFGFEKVFYWVIFTKFPTPNTVIKHLKRETNACLIVEWLQQALGYQIRR